MTLTLPGFLLTVLPLAVLLNSNNVVETLYTYFPTTELEANMSVDLLNKTLRSPQYPKMNYVTLVETQNPPDIMYGRFHGFFELFRKQLANKSREDTFAVRKALANVIHYTEGGTFYRQSRQLKDRSVGFQDLLDMWDIYYYCLTTYRFREDYNPCTAYFTKSDKNKANYYIMQLDWDPARDLRLIPLGREMLRIIFNLGLCQHFQYGAKFFCPNLCFGRAQRGSLWTGLPTVPGNPCIQIHNVKSLTCKSKRIWSSFIHQMFSELVDPQTWKLIPGEGSFLRWVKQESGYACDCTENYEWAETSMGCEPRAGWIDKCKGPSKEDKGPCDKEGTYECITEESTGEARCECRLGYAGRFCKTKYDACEMEIVSYVARNPVTNRIERMVSNGNQLCNINMSGMSISTVFGKMDAGSNKTEVKSLVSRCLPELGTFLYQCECVEPFSYDEHISVPNCLRRSSPCDKVLCVHGTCVTSVTKGAPAVCVCDLGYDGPRCEEKSSHWTVWSECLPVCGRNRKRKRRRTTGLRDPAPWKPREDNSMGLQSDVLNERPGRFIGEIVQVEICPPRVGSACPLVTAHDSTGAHGHYDIQTIEFQSTFIAVSILCTIFLLLSVYVLHAVALIKF